MHITKTHSHKTLVVTIFYDNFIYETYRNIGESKGETAGKKRQKKGLKLKIMSLTMYEMGVMIIVGGIFCRQFFLVFST